MSNRLGVFLVLVLIGVAVHKLYVRNHQPTPINTSRVHVSLRDFPVGRSGYVVPWDLDKKSLIPSDKDITLFPEPGKGFVLKVHKDSTTSCYAFDNKGKKVLLTIR